MTRHLVRRRTSRKALVANELQFEQLISPLDYEPTGFGKGSVKRLAIVDTDAPEPPRKYPYFQDREVRSYTGKTGRRLKKPRITIEPGAAPGTVAFLDYVIFGSPGTWGHSAYINYMSTRGDQRGKGLARTLLAEFMAKMAKDGVPSVSFGKVLNPAVWKMYEGYRAAYEGGSSDIKVDGRRDF